MRFLRQIGGALFVLLISTTIFFLVVKEQTVKKDILRTALELFGNDLLAMIPDGPEKAMVEAGLAEFIDRAQRNELAEEEIQRTIAAGLNLRLRPAPLKPQEVAELFRISRPEPGAAPHYRRAVNRERLAQDINRLMQVSREWERLEREAVLDSLLHNARPLFAADSGFKILLPAQVMEMEARAVPSDLNEQLQRLQQERMIVLYDLRRLPATLPEHFPRRFLPPAIPS